MVLLTDILTNNISWIIAWVVVFVIALTIELTTEQLVSIWFAGGSIVALILAICNVVWWVQIIVFIVLSAGLLIGFKILFKSRKGKDIPTNADSLIGTEIIVTKTVNKDSFGEGKVRDIVWSIAVNDNIEIKEGEKGIIKEISGNHLIIERKGN